MEKRTHTIELSDKELYLLWAIACWFNNPVTATLKRKLSKLASSPMRRTFASRYDTEIEDRLISTGTWLAEYRKREKRDAV